MGGPGDTKLNPDMHLPNIRLHDVYDSKFGGDHFESKYPVAEKNAIAFETPWEWEMYNYGP